MTVSADSPPLVRCTIEVESDVAEPEKPLADAKPRPALTISAVLGRSRRFAEGVRQAAVRPKANLVPTPATEPATP